MTVCVHLAVLSQRALEGTLGHLGTVAQPLSQPCPFGRRPAAFACCSAPSRGPSPWTPGALDSRALALAPRPQQPLPTQQPPRRAHAACPRGRPPGRCRRRGAPPPLRPCHWHQSPWRAYWCSARRRCGGTWSCCCCTACCTAASTWSLPTFRAAASSPGCWAVRAGSGGWGFRGPRRGGHHGGPALGGYGHGGAG